MTKSDDESFRVCKISGWKSFLLRHLPALLLKRCLKSNHLFNIPIISWSLSMIYGLRTMPVNRSNIGEAKLYIFDRKPIVLNFVKNRYESRYSSLGFFFPADSPFARSSIYCCCTYCIDWFVGSTSYEPYAIFASAFISSSFRRYASSSSPSYLDALYSCSISS